MNNIGCMVVVVDAKLVGFFMCDVWFEFTIEE